MELSPKIYEDDLDINTLFSELLSEITGKVPPMGYTKLHANFLEIRNECVSTVVLA